MPTKSHSRRELFACLAVLAAVIVFLLHDSLLTGKGLTPADGIFRLPPWKGLGPVSNPVLSDQYLTLEPLRVFFHRHFALWNPYISCGVPQIALMQAAPLYPINLLLSFLDPFHAGAPAAFLKLFLAGAFMILYMRELSASWAASLYSGIAFSLSGFMIVWLGHPHVNSACLIPLLFYLMEKKNWTALALAYGVMALGGHAPTIIHVSLALAAYFAFKRREDKALKPPAFLLALALGALLAAPQLLPYLEYVRLSSCAAASQGLERWAGHLPIMGLFFYLMPLLAGSPTLHNEVLGAALGFTGAPNESFNERTGYVGVLTLFLAAAALLARRDRSVKFLALMSLACLYAALGLPPAPQIIRTLPVLNVINNGRLLLFTGFGLAALGGLGLDALAGLSPRRLLLGGGLAAAGFLFCVFLLFQPIMGELSHSEKIFLFAQFPIFLGAAAAAGLALRFRSSGWIKPLCVAWTSIELIYYGIGYNPAVSRELYYPRTKAIEFLQADSSLFRILGMGWTLPPNTGLLYGLQDARGQDFTTVKRYEELITGTAGDFFFYSTVGSLPPSLASLGVKYLLAERGWRAPERGFRRVYDGEIEVYQAKSASPRARIVFDNELVPADQILARVRAPDFDPGKKLLLEERPATDPGVPGPAETKVVSYAPDEVVVSAKTAAPAFLLLLDTYYPGWKAFVNGKPARIYRADYNFRAVSVPAGASEVRFVYAPASFYAGLSLAALALVVLAGMRLRAGRVRA